MAPYKTGNSSGRLTGRSKTERVKTARRRKNSSTRWLQRQLNDPYVAEAKKRGYRSRAAFKLIQLDERFKLLKKGARVIDLGAAPGGWSQVAGERGCAKVVAVDYLAMDPLPGVNVLLLDFLEEGADKKVAEALNGQADVVLSDMAAPTTGHAPTDHMRITALAEIALDFARQVLAPGGSFVCKVFQGGAEKDLLTLLKRDFATVRHAKPEASRKDSAETYLVATGFRGRAAAEAAASGADANGADAYGADASRTDAKGADTSE